MTTLHAQLKYVLIFLTVLGAASLVALVMFVILGVERTNAEQVSEHRKFNQMDHNSVCRMLQDEARVEGRKVYPCGSEAHQ